MAHIKATAEEIRDVIQRRIELSTALDGDCRDSKAPRPVVTVEPNSGGSYWTVTVLPGRVPGCKDFVLEIVRNVMVEFELLE